MRQVILFQLFYTSCLQTVLEILKVFFCTGKRKLYFININFISFFFCVYIFAFIIYNTIEHMYDLSEHNSCMKDSMLLMGKEVASVANKSFSFPFLRLWSCTCLPKLTSACSKGSKAPGWKPSQLLTLVLMNLCQTTLTYSGLISQ